MKLLSAFVYPVKSMRGIEVSTLTLDAQGVVGDRRWMVVDAKDQFLTQRATPALARIQPTLIAEGLRLEDEGGRVEVPMPPLTALRRRVTVWRDTVDALDAGDEVAAWLSTRLGAGVRLVAFAPDVRREVDVTYARDAQTTFTDAYPALIVNEASLDALNAKLERAIPMNRFRPNLVVRAESAWVEDGWRKLKVDGLAFDSVKPCARCVAITTDQHSGARPDGSAPLTVLNDLHGLPGKGAIFGMNLVHRALGSLRVGGEVHVDANPSAHLG